jgi:hypothetical protein
MQDTRLQECGEEKAKGMFHLKCRSGRKKVSSLPFLHFFFSLGFFSFFLLEKKKMMAMVVIFFFHFIFLFETKKATAQTFVTFFSSVFCCEQGDDNKLVVIARFFLLSI